MLCCKMAKNCRFLIFPPPNVSRFLWIVYKKWWRKKWRKKLPTATTLDWLEFNKKSSSWHQQQANLINAYFSHFFPLIPEQVCDFAHTYVARRQSILASLRPPRLRVLKLHKQVFQAYYMYSRHTRAGWFQKCLGTGPRNLDSAGV